MGKSRTLRFRVAVVLAIAFFCEDSAVAAEAEIRITALVGSDGENKQIELRNGDIVRSGTRFRLVVTGSPGQSVFGHFTNHEGLIRPLSKSPILLSGGKAVLPRDDAWYQIERDSDGLVSFYLNFGEGSDAELTASTSLFFIAGNSSAYGISKLPEVRGIQTLKPKPAFFPEQILNAKARATAARTYFAQLDEASLAENSISMIGANDISIFEHAATGIVLVVTEDGFGTGALLSSDGLILTNFHVIAGNEEIGIVFKPEAGLDVELSDVLTAQVEKVDQVADLALLHVQSPPSHARVLKLASIDEAEVGLIVHNIGHPGEKLWTYTNAFISQVQAQYEWPEHVADVIQTGSPVNPANFGGTLVTDDAKIIGINSFRLGDPAYQGTNFAISVSEIESFLEAKQDRYIEGLEPVEPTQVLQPAYVMIDTDENGIDDVAAIDYDSNSILDMYVYNENDDGILDFILVDRNENGTPDGRMVSREVGGFGVDVWEFDEDENGSIDVIGIDYNQDGEIDRYRET